jgi:hypothetical protein
MLNNTSCTPLQTNITTSKEVPQNECKTKEKSGKIRVEEGKSVGLATQTNKSTNLTLQTNIKKEQNHAQTGLQANIKHKLQQGNQPSLFNF